MGYLYTVILVLAVFKTVSVQSLHCWKCQGEQMCADEFNQTRIRNLPREFGSIDASKPIEESCDSYLSHQDIEHRAVCEKKVELINGQKHYTRRCSFVHADLPVGECLKEVRQNPHQQLVYCQQCDSDYCNSSNMPSSTVYWSILASILSILFLKQ